MKVIVRRWPFWASTPGLRGQPGARHGACLRGTACGARLCGSHHLGSDVGERNLAPVSGYHLSKTIPIDELGPGGLSRARLDRITRFAARGVHGLENGIHRRPARQVQAGLIYGRRAGRVALGARTGAVSCHTPWRDACARVGVLVLGGRLRGGQLGCSTQSGISFVVSLGRGGKSFALSAGPKVLSHTIPSKARWAINGRRSRDQGASGGRLKRSAWNGTEGSGRKRRPADAQAEALGYAG
jgi:hypothetical protein